MLDTSASPLSDCRVREAISLAIDRTALASVRFGYSPAERPARRLAWP
ncbi:MAG: hypothetical protein U0470_13595 [Anaerolineae bacterium]